jgi:hypothetical protein
MVQGLKFPSQNPNPRGEEGGKERTETRLREEQSTFVLASGGKKNWLPKRKGVRGFFNPNNSHPKRLHYPWTQINTRKPVGAKPEKDT